MTEIAALGLKVTGVSDSDRAAKSLDGLAKASDRAEKSSTGLTGSAKKTTKSVVDVGESANSTSRSVDRLADVAKKAGTYLGIYLGGAAIVQGVRSTIRVYADFESQMARVNAVSRATADELAALTDTARYLGATTEFTATQAGEGIEFLARAGFTAAESIAAIPAVLNLATAASLDLGRAADVASNIMSAYSIAADDASSVTDILAAASARANTDVQQLGDAMGYVGPVAAALNISMGDSAAAIGALSDAGIQGSAAGTGLRRVLSSLANPTAAARSEFSALGITVEQLNPASNDLADIIDRLADSGISAAQALTIFGDRGGPALLALVEQRFKVRELAETLRDVEGESQRMADTIRDTLTGDLQSLASAAQDVQISLAEAFSPELREGVQSTTALVRAIGENLDTVGNIAAGVAIIIGARLTGATVSATAALIAKTAAATRATAVMNPYTGALVRTTVATNSLALASRGGAAALGFVGGPAGAAFIAAAGLVYFVTRTNNTIEAAERLEKQLNSTAGAFDALTVAQARSERVDVRGDFEKATSELDKLQRKYDEMRRRLEQRGFDLSDPDRLPDTFAKMEKAIEAAQGRVNTFSRALGELNDIIEFGYSNDADPFDAITDAAGNIIETSKALDELTESQQRNSEEIDKSISALERAAYAWGLSAGEVKILDLAQQGATESQLEYARALIGTVEGWEKAAEAQSNYLSLVEDLRTDEEKLTDQLRERLAVLDAIGTATEQDYSRTAAAAFSDAPQFGGLAPEVGGAFGELSKINDAQMELQGWYDTQLEMLENYRSEEGRLNQQWDAEEERIRKEHQDRLADIDRARRLAQLSATEETFGSLADLARGFAGEQSGIYRTLFAIEKAASVARATVAIQTGIAEAAANPWPTNLGAMASVAAATAGIVGAISGVNIKGFQSGGYTGNAGVSDIAGVVHGREFVFDAAATRRIGAGNLEAMRSGKSVSGEITINMIEDSSRAGQVQERQGDDESRIVDIFVANLMGDGKTQQAISRKFGMRAVGQ